MPINAVPSRGYTDWQRVSNYDSGVLWNLPSTVTSGTLQSGLQEVSRYAYIAGFIGLTAGQSIFGANWYDDAAGTILVGQRIMTLSSNITHLAQLRLPNLGPFTNIQLMPISGASYTAQGQMFGTNRVHPLEFIPANAVPLDQQTVALAAGVNLVYPTDYYAGPMQVWFQPTVGPVNVALQSLSTTGTWDFINQVLAIAANADTTQTWIAPPGAWRLSLNNSGSAGTMFLAATPSTSGAA